MSGNVTLVDEWQMALEQFGCGEQTAMRACLIGSLAARLARHPDGPAIWHDAVQDAITLTAEATR